jgi:RNA polymerase sigma factor (sigma-70 family)
MDKTPPTKLPSELPRLFREARQGNEDAARLIVERYGKAIRRSVRHYLHQKLRAKFDSSDFEQAVWASFFNGQNELDDFTSSTDLMRFLTKVARNKVVDEFRRRVQGKKYNVNRERSLNDPAAPLDFAAAPATPSQMAIAGEEWERLLADAPSHHRRVMRMRMEGAKFTEIAEAEELHERTARRVIARAKQQVEST